MAETSFWWTTDGTGDGKIGGYTRADHSLWTAILAACCGKEGVAPGYGNALAAAANGANTVTVPTGGALVDGKPYNNSAPVNVNIPSASGAGNTRIDRVVLRADWAAQTVRITRIAGVDAATPSLPAITQDSGNVYDIPICQVLVNTAGAVTVTDERVMADVPTTGIENNAVTNPKLRDSSALSVIGRAANSVGDPADIVASANDRLLARVSNALQWVQLTLGMIPDALITGAKFAANLVYTSSMRITGGLNLGTQSGAPDGGLFASGGAYLDGNCAIGNTMAYYWGLASSEEGRWRATRSGTSWLLQRQESNVWVTKATFLATENVRGVTNGNSHDHSGGDGAPIPAGGLANGAVDTTARLADDIVDDTKVGNRVPQFRRRQGGNATHWSFTGSTDYTVGAIRMQGGAAQSSSSAAVTITFPEEFGGTPLVYLQLVGNVLHHVAVCSDITLTTFDLHVMDLDTGERALAYVNWLAIGPE